MSGARLLLSAMAADIWSSAHRYELGDIVLVRRIERRRWWQFWRRMARGEPTLCFFRIKIDPTT
jgi:hypothetical protein